ncbi:MAG: hypothetical protein WBP64_11810 [Nitrososphaeraceae archaeon]|jgi:hypothetical protein
MGIAIGVAAVTVGFLIIVLGLFLAFATYAMNMILSTAGPFLLLSLALIVIGAWLIYKGKHAIDRAKGVKQ